MEFDKNTEGKIEELQILERNLQGFLMQRQSFQVEINEAANAIEEVKKSKEEVYKILGNIMIKTDPGSIIKELEEKRRILELRIKSIEKQEKIFEEKVERLKVEINQVITKDTKQKT